MASSVLRRYLPQRASLRRSFPPHLPSAAAGAFRRSFQSGDRETLDEFDERMFGTKDTDEGSVYAKLDRVGNPSRRYGIGSGSSVGGFSGFGDRSGSGSSVGGFSGFGDRSGSGSSVGGFSGFGDRSGSGSSVGGFSGFGDRSGSGSSVGGFPGVSDRSSSGSAMRDFPGFSDRNGSGSAMGGLGGFSDNSSSWSSRSYDSWNEGINQELVNVARNVQMDDDDDDDDGNEVEQDDFEFRSDVRFRRGATYSVRDLDLRRPAVAKNPPRQQFKTTTAEVLRKADFRNVRFLSHFLTEAGIIIKRSQTRISAKAQRKIAREIKTARAFGLMPFTTMGRRPFIFGRSAEEHYSDEEHFGFMGQRDGEPVEDNGHEEPNVEVA